MSLTLHVDAARWRAHHDQVVATPGLVPVVKGNGYGFGRDRLAAEVVRLGAATLAVGLATEVADVRAGGYPGDVLVLQPWSAAADDAAAGDDRLIFTASTPEGVRGLAGRRTVVELMSSVRRFGLTADELTACAAAVREVRLEGIALHLPITGLGPDAAVGEVVAAVGTARDLGLPVEQLWLSHVGTADLARLRDLLPGVELRPRVGTRLWLGDRAAFRVTAEVLAVHHVRRGERFGYRQRRALRDGTLLVVSGGTSHGIALAAPSPVTGARQRARAAATGGLEAAGRSLSPYHVAGSRRWFAEPPHMQVSMLWLPASVAAPRPGDELAVDVRMTTTTVDRVAVD
jgi:alanine racemase